MHLNRRTNNRIGQLVFRHSSPPSRTPTSHTAHSPRCSAPPPLRVSTSQPTARHIIENLSERSSGFISRPVGRHTLQSPINESSMFILQFANNRRVEQVGGSRERGR